MQEFEQTRRPDTTRDQRRDAQLMRRLGYTQSAISAELGLSLGQVQYALSHTETPITRPGRPSKLTEAQIQELKAFMASKDNDKMSYGKIAQALGWDVGEYCIRHTLRKLGYKRTADGRKKLGAARVQQKPAYMDAEPAPDPSAASRSDPGHISDGAGLGSSRSGTDA
ncbi:hypothetical protein V8C35DRAFT_234767 [Trichoderma chlorosporum]